MCYHLPTYKLRFMRHIKRKTKIVRLLENEPIKNPPEFLDKLFVRWHVSGREWKWHFASSDVWTNRFSAVHFLFSFEKSWMWEKCFEIAYFCYAIIVFIVGNEFLDSNISNWILLFSIWRLQDRHAARRSFATIVWRKFQRFSYEKHSKEIFEWENDERELWAMKWDNAFFLKFKFQVILFTTQSAFKTTFKSKNYLTPHKPLQLFFFSDLRNYFIISLTWLYFTLTLYFYIQYIIFF